MPGYIKLYRDLQENKLWREKRKFSKAEAFIDLMFRCNHRCDRLQQGYGSVLVKRGQFLSSNYKLAEYWNWSESSVRVFIKYLVKEGMITVYPSEKNTLYEISNYCVYQAVDTTEFEENQNAQKTHKKRTGNAQKTPNKNDNNVNNVKEVINKYTDDSSLKQAILDFVEMRTVKKKAPTDKAMKLILNTLKQYDVETQKKMLEKSTINQWSDVYPLKEVKPNAVIQGNSAKVFKYDKKQFLANAGN